MHADNRAWALLALGRVFPEQLVDAPRPGRDRLANALASGATVPAVTESLGRPVKKTYRSSGHEAA